MSTHNDARTTVEFAIRNALVENWPITHDSLEQAIQSIIDEGRSGSTGWAFREVFGGA